MGKPCEGTLHRSRLITRVHESQPVDTPHTRDARARPRRLSRRVTPARARRGRDAVAHDDVDVVRVDGVARERRRAPVVSVSVAIFSASIVRARANAGVDIPTLLNNTPHARETRAWFYDDCAKSIAAAVTSKERRIKIKTEFPELNVAASVRVGRRWSSCDGWRRRWREMECESRCVYSEAWGKGCFRRCR